MRGEEPSVRDAIFGMCHDRFPHDYLVHSRHKYIHYHATGEEQLFDLEADPHETRDFAGCRPCANQSPRVFWDDATG